MIAKKYRFHGRRGPRFTLTRGRVLKSDFFQLRYLHNSRQSNYRLAVVVSKRVDKKAVIRNKIRRRLYEVFRLGLKDLVTPVDIVVVVYKKELAFMPASQLKAICEPLLVQIVSHERASK